MKKLRSHEATEPRSGKQAAELLSCYLKRCRLLASGFQQIQQQNTDADRTDVTDLHTSG